MGIVRARGDSCNTPRRYRLPPRPTVCEAMLGMAALGGHIANNSPLGWFVLGRGLTRLVDAEVGW